METVAATERGDVSEAGSSKQRRKRKRTRNPDIHGKKRRKETPDTLKSETENSLRRSRFPWKLVKREKNLAKKEKKLLEKEKMLAEKEKNLLKKLSSTGEELEELGGKEVPQTLIDYFCQTKEKAIQHFNFVDYLREQCDFIKHDSCPDDVLVSGELPMKKFYLVDEEDIMNSLKVHILRLKAAYNTRLYYKYCLYLPSCDFIKYDSSRSEVLEELKKDTNFQEQNFLVVPSSKLIYGLEFYITYLFEMKNRKGSKIFDYAEEMERQLERKLLLYKQKPCPVGYVDPIYNLVFKTREKGYVMDEDPKVEILKIMNSYGTYCQFRLPNHPEYQQSVGKDSRLSLQDQIPE